MVELPHGTVTLLFTDIEGSTRLLQRLGETLYADALTTHQRLIREAVATHQGYEVDTQGDSFFIAFERARDAVDAAVDAQRALAAYPWPEGDTVLVRMGLHTGEPTASGGRYVGVDVHRAARVGDAGHGGQILLSQTTADLVAYELPAGGSLLDLGQHRLKDLSHPEHLYQLVVPGLPTDFPPLRTMDVRPHNLPVQSTPLIGREAEVAAVTALLARDDVRLVTLTGPGGVGKTRLALQVAAELVDRFDDGVFFVALAPVNDPALVICSITQSLGVSDAGDRPLRESLQFALRERELLLVLDNFEQVVVAAPLVTELLAAAPRLKALVTSRATLRIYGEHEYPVPPLPVPDPAHLPPLEQLPEYAAVQLFVQRARAARPDFQLTAGNARAVAAICRRLDGLPLAIELAAARVRLLPPPVLLSRLERRLQVLVGGARDLPPRQQTLRGAISWSYDLLEPGEQTLFRRLAVFVAGCTLEAAEAVGQAIDDLPLEVLDGLESLVSKSLLRQDMRSDGEPCFTMLETIREYAAERLAVSGEEAALQRAHAAYYLALAEEVEPALTGPAHETWLKRTEEEHDNYRAALGWALRHGETRMALRLAIGLQWFWYFRGHLREGRQWLEAALAMPGTVPPDLRASALSGTGSLATAQGDARRARESLEASLALWREVGDDAWTSRVLHNLGVLALLEGDEARATALLEESLALARDLDDPDFAQTGQILNLAYLAIAALSRGDHARATELAQQSLALSRAVGFAPGISEALNTLGWVAVEEGDTARAALLLSESLALLRDTGNRQGLPWNLESAAAVAGSLGYGTRAARLLGAADALRELIGSPLPPSERARQERYIMAACAQLDQATWDAAWAEGRAMTTEQAIAYALEGGAA